MSGVRKKGSDNWRRGQGFTFRPPRKGTLRMERRKETRQVVLNKERTKGFLASSAKGGKTGASPKS